MPLSLASVSLLNRAKGNWKITFSVLNKRSKTFCFLDFLLARNLDKFPVLYLLVQTKIFNEAFKGFMNS